MQFSLRAIELCRMKFGKGLFCGFEQVNEGLIDNLLEQEAKKEMDELTKNGIIGLFDGEVHISPLGQHIFNMMYEPEQFIMLDNEMTSKCVRMYIKNTYYLCVIEDKKVKSDTDYERYQFKLLPKLDLVIGSFVYILYVDEKDVLNKSNDYDKNEIRIVGKAWDKERKIISELKIDGNYYNEDVLYKLSENEGVKNKQEDFQTDVSELINKLTKWMFDKISKSMKDEPEQIIEEER